MGFQRNRKTISIYIIWNTLLCSSTTLGWSSYHSKEYDEDHVDFTDMGSYNHGFQKNMNGNGRRYGFDSPGGLEEETVKITRYRYDETTDPSFDEMEGSVSTKVKAPHRAANYDIENGDHSGLKTIEIIESTKKYQSVQASASVNDSTSMKFLKRIVASLMRQMNVRSHVFGPGEAITIDLQAEISYAHFMTLTKFVSDGNVDGAEYLSQVDLILSNMLHVVTAPLTPNFFETLKDGLQSLFTAFITPKTIIIVAIMSLFVFIASIIAWRIRYSRSVYQMVKYGFLIIFLVSCVWSFIAMYEDAKAKNYSRMMQTQDVPPDCEFDRMGVWDSLSYFFRVQLFKYEDRCVEYHKEVMVDPFWRVSPTEAISHTFASLVFHPAEYVGSKLGKFFYNASNVFPFWMQPFVLILLFFFVFLGAFGFKIKTPLFSIEPGVSYNNNTREGNYLNDSEESPNRLEHHSRTQEQQQQVAERPAAEVVEVKTRDANVDTSDFEEYLRRTQSRSRRQSEIEDLPEIPELPSHSSRRKYDFQFFTSWMKKSSLLCIIISGIFNIVVIILDKGLRQVPFVGTETNFVSADFAIP